jgi:hypothetical protein
MTTEGAGMTWEAMRMTMVEVLQNHCHPRESGDPEIIIEGICDLF